MKISFLILINITFLNGCYEIYGRYFQLVYKRSYVIDYPMVTEKNFVFIKKKHKQLFKVLSFI